jgi:ergothioneine biosynthesis protein EgtB
VAPHSPVDQAGSTPETDALDPDAAAPVGDDLAAAYARIRAATLALCDPLEVEDYGVQPMVDASPPKWHLAHTTWFFETFLLKALVPGYRPFDPAYESLFNSYYNGVGSPYPRADRGLLSRPTVAEVRSYRAHVDAAMAPLLADGGARLGSARETLVVGLHHEQQHQELLLTDLKANFGRNPLAPRYCAAPQSPSRPAPPLGYTRIDGGLVSIGAAARAVRRYDDFVFDNETPPHRVWLEPFAVADRLVTNGEYLEFMADGAYEEPSLWLSDGWAHLQRTGWQAPLYWSFDGENGWTHYTLAGRRAVDRAEPVTHLSYYEADAFARWCGARLPTEPEWETAAARAGRCGDFVESGRLQPAPAASGPLAQFFGDAWEWTASPYGPYPGYRPYGGTLGEYNGKFMSNQVVLRGGSCATPAAHVRPTYRNFFYPPDRWQFTGLRLVRNDP